MKTLRMVDWQGLQKRQCLCFGLIFALAGLLQAQKAGTLDLGFSPGRGARENSAATYGATIRAMAVQADGKLIIGGSFAEVGGYGCFGLARFNLDGTLDRNYLVQIEGSLVAALHLCPDGKLLIGGTFTKVSGANRRGLARLNPEGTLDTTFDPPWDYSGTTSIGQQSNGNLLVASQYRLYRLLPSGLQDTTFTPRQLDWHQTRILVQTNDKILLGGLQRLLADGAPDTGYEAYVNRTPGGVSVYSTALQPDGKILLGGRFMLREGANSNNVDYAIVRLNSDGSLDAGFQHISGTCMPGYEATVNSLAVQPDGKIIAGGQFLEINGQRQCGVARFEADGRLDSGFQSEVEISDWGNDGEYVLLMALAPADRLYISGYLTRINGVPRWSVARLWTQAAEAPALFSLEPVELWVNETNLQAVITVNRQGQLDQPVRAAFTTDNANWQPSPATPGLQFIPQSGELEFGPSETQKQIMIGLRDDHMPAFNSQLLVRLQTAGAAAGPSVLGYPVESRIVIVDDQSLGKPGSVDESFTSPFPAEYKHPGVTGLVLDGDQNIYVRGAFNPSAEPAPGMIVRLKRNGQMDTNFSVSLDGEVMAFAWDKSFRRLLVGGSFTNINGITHPFLAGLDANGVLAASFTVSADGPVSQILQCASGQWYIGGGFTKVDGEIRTGLARLQANGSVDIAFDPQFTYASGNESINLSRPLALQSDGKLLVGGSLYNQGLLTRLNQDGSLDASFVAQIPSAMVYCLAVVAQTDGRILLGGFFSQRAEPYGSVLRLLPDGRIDTEYRSEFGGSVNSLYMLADGRILVGGSVDFYAQGTHRSVARMFPDGTLDRNFFVGFFDNYALNATLVEPDGAVLIGGKFLTVNNLPYPFLARLHGDAGFSPATSPGLAVLASEQFSTTTSAGGLAIPIYRIWGTNGDLTIDYQVTNNATSSFPNQSGTVRFAAGETGPQQVIIPFPEPVHRWPGGEGYILLSASQPAHSLGFPTQARLTVNTSAGVVHFSSTQYYLSESNGMIRITVSGHDAAPGSVKYSTLDGSAKAGLDYEAKAGTVAFPANTWTPQIIEIRILDNSQAQSHRTFYLQFTEPSTNLIFLNTNVIAITILDDDLNFAPGQVDTRFRTSVANPVAAVAVSADHRILQIGGTAMIREITQTNLARLLPGGALDDSFLPLVSSQQSVFVMSALAWQPDGKVLVAGGFDRINETPSAGLARLDQNGSLDPAFEAGRGIGGASNPVIHALLVQPDGRILMAGCFDQVDGQEKHHVARLMANGSVDTSFDAGASAGGTTNPVIHTVALQTNGQILVGGGFLSFDQRARTNLARLNPDGSLDPTFTSSTHPGGLVETIALQPDGRVLIGGAFASVNGVSSRQLARLDANGSLDTSFAFGSGPQGKEARIKRIALQSDGKILVAGSFSEFSGKAIDCLARLNPDGSLDSSFAHQSVQGESPIINDIAIQNDGQIILGGQFAGFDDIACANLIRLNGYPFQAERFIQFDHAATRRSPAGEIQLKLMVTAGAAFFLESSTDLRAWTPIHTNCTFQPGFEYVDRSATNQPKLFYRALLLP